MSFNQEDKKTQRPYTTPYPTKKPQKSSIGAKVGIGGAIATGALAAAKAATNTVRLNPNFGHVGSVMGIGESEFFNRLNQRLLESGTGTTQPEKQEPEEQEHEQNEDRQEKVTKLKDFGSNHNEFMLTLKAFGRKLPDTNNLGDTHIEERLKISGDTYRNVLKILEKDFSKQEK